MAVQHRESCLQATPERVPPCEECAASQAALLTEFWLLRDAGM